MTASWVNVVTDSIPTVSEFNTTGGQGSPINITQSGKAFALINNTVTPLNCMPIAPTRAVLAAVIGQSFGDIYYLTEKGREGFFEWAAASIVAPTTVSLVTTDTQQGIFIPPLSDPTGASGAWVRIFSGVVEANWFGATGLGSPTNDYTAIQSAINFQKAVAINPVNTFYKASNALLIQQGKFYIGANTLEISHTLHVKGAGGIGFGNGGGAATMIYCDDGVTCIRIQEYNTSGVSTVDPSPFHFTGAYTTLEDLYIYGKYSGVESESHGIHTKTKINLINVQVDNFSGDALYAHTSNGAGSPTEGNSNTSRAYNCHFHSSRNGVSITGGDANAWLFEACFFDFNRQWGTNDTTFLGNTYNACHEDTNGIVTASAAFGASVVSYLGNRYAVIYGREATASVTAPSGNTTDTVNWYYISAGGVNTSNLFIPAWVSGMSLRAGGPMLLSNANQNSMVTGNYSEGGQGPIQQTQLGIILGGSNNATVKGGSWLRGFTGGYFMTSPQIVKGTFQQFQRNGESFIIDGSTDATALANVGVNLKTGVAGTGFSSINFITSLGATMGKVWCGENFGLICDGNLGVLLRYNGGDTLDVNATGINLTTGKNIQVNGVQVLSAPKTGWSLATGTANRATWDTASVTLTTLAQTVKALIDDLHATAGHGIIRT